MTEHHHDENVFSKKTFIGILIGVVGSLISAAIIAKYTDAFKFTWELLKIVWSYLLSSKPIPVWLITLIAIYLLRKFWLAIKRVHHGLITPHYNEYTEDVIKGVKWK